MKHLLTNLLNGQLGRCLKTVNDVLSYRVQSQSNSTAILDVTFKTGKKQKIRISRYDLSTFDNEVDPVGTIVIPATFRINTVVYYENKTLTNSETEFRLILNNLVLFFNDEKINIPLKEVSVVANGNDVYLKAREKSLVFKGKLKLTDMLIIGTGE